MPKEPTKQTEMAFSSAKTAVMAHAKASPVGMAVWVASGIAITCAASYWVPMLWRSKAARRALGAGISAAVACLAQELDEID